MALSYSATNPYFAVTTGIDYGYNHLHNLLDSYQRQLEYANRENHALQVNISSQAVKKAQDLKSIISYFYMRK